MTGRRGISFCGRSRLRFTTVDDRYQLLVIPIARAREGGRGGGGKGSRGPGVRTPAFLCMIPHHTQEYTSTRHSTATHVYTNTNCTATDQRVLPRTISDPWRLVRPNNWCHDSVVLDGSVLRWWGNTAYYDGGQGSIMFLIFAVTQIIGV